MISHPSEQAQAGDEGSAVVEFVFLGVLLLVPLIYLTLMVARVQAGSYAVAQAAREAGRAFVTTVDGQDPGLRADAAALIAFADQGFDTSDSGITISCSTSPCLTPEGRVEVRAEVSVPLPLIPSFARSVVPLVVPVSSTHVLIVDRFRGVG
ncbi:TadE family protein [Nostocoides vanveenii]|uniref:TadE family protein n=1 Tax=Nostocoides vanveenii TaxID=330835 RepID=A0ABN2K6P0_9MICO